MVAARISGMDDISGSMGKVGLFMVTDLCGLLIHSLIVLPLVYFVVTRKNPYVFMKGLGDALMTAFSIASRFVAKNTFRLTLSIRKWAIVVPINEVLTSSLPSSRAVLLRGTVCCAVQGGSNF